MDNKHIFSVSELAEYLKSVIANKKVKVTGEISQPKLSGGHLYFSLKDDSTNLKSIIWKSKNINKDEIIDGNLSDDDLIEILNCAKVSIYNIINSHPSINSTTTSTIHDIHNDIEIIRDVLKFIEILYYKIEIQTDFSIDTDELENLIHDILIKKILKEIVYGVEIKIYNEPDWFRRFRGAIDYTRIVNFYN